MLLCKHMTVQTLRARGSSLHCGTLSRELVRQTHAVQSR